MELNYHFLYERETGVVLKHGENLIRSPFRPDEDETSLFVNTDDDFWYDLHAGISGNIYDFVMRKNGLTREQAEAVVNHIPIPARVAIGDDVGRDE